MLSTLQDAWPRPLDAMEELEKLLLRKRSGELFELPAYRDVLTGQEIAPAAPLALEPYQVAWLKPVG